MKRENSLLAYLLDAKQEGLDGLMERLAVEDIEIPPCLRHTLQFARQYDEEKRMKSSSDDPEIRGLERNWLLDRWVKHYPKLTVNEIMATYKHAAPAAQLVSDKNHPRLFRLFRDLCDEMELRPNGQYPRLIVTQSDIVQASAGVAKGEIPTVFISSAVFDVLTTRMITALLQHELHHVAKTCNPGFKNRMLKRFMPVRARWWEEYDADKAALSLGISGDDLAEGQLQELQHNMRVKKVAQDIMHQVADYLPEAMLKKPAFFDILSYLAEEAHNILASKDDHLHPPVKRRIEHVLNQPPRPNVKWSEKLQEEFNHGSLLGK